MLSRRCHLACLHPPPSAGVGGRCDFLHTTVPLEEGPRFPRRPGTGAEPARGPPGCPCAATPGPRTGSTPASSAAFTRRPGWGLAGSRPGPQSSVPPPTPHPFSKHTHFLTKWKADLCRQRVSQGCALAPTSQARLPTPRRLRPALRTPRAPLRTTLAHLLGVHCQCHKGVFFPKVDTALETRDPCSSASAARHRPCVLRGPGTDVTSRVAWRGRVCRGGFFM